MPSAISRTNKHRFPKRRNSMANRPQPTTPISIVSAAKAGSVITIVFNQQVALKGVPQYTLTGAAVTPVSAAMTTPTTLAITYSGAVTAASAVNVPYEEPSVRNSSGGFVRDSTFPVT